MLDKFNPLPPASEKTTSIYRGAVFIAFFETVPVFAGKERAAVGGVTSAGTFTETPITPATMPVSFVQTKSNCPEFVAVLQSASSASWIVPTLNNCQLSHPTPTTGPTTPRAALISVAVIIAFPTSSPALKDDFVAAK